MILDAKGHPVEVAPHFQEQAGPLVPIARFEPTEDGWRMAVALVRREAR